VRFSRDGRYWAYERREDLKKIPLAVTGYDIQYRLTIRLHDALSGEFVGIVGAAKEGEVRWAQGVAIKGEIDPLLPKRGCGEDGFRVRMKDAQSISLFPAIPRFPRITVQGSPQHTLTLRELVTGRTVLWTSPGGSIHHVVLAPNGKFLAIAHHNRKDAGGYYVLVVLDLTPALNALQQPRESFSEPELTTLWHDLAAEDVSIAHRAATALAHAPRLAHELFKTHLRTNSPLARISVEELLHELTNPDPARRNAVERELVGRELAASQLQKYGKTATEPELRTRVHRLEALCNSRFHKEQGRINRICWCLESLEFMADEESKRMLTSVAAEHPDAWVRSEAKAALERLTKQRQTEGWWQ
jgi:hypothetical protein